MEGWAVVFHDRGCAWYRPIAGRFGWPVRINDSERAPIIHILIILFFHNYKLLRWITWFTGRWKTQWIAITSTNYRYYECHVFECILRRWVMLFGICDSGYVSFKTAVCYWYCFGFFVYRLYFWRAWYYVPSFDVVRFASDFIMIQCSAFVSKRATYRLRGVFSRVFRILFFTLGCRAPFFGWLKNLVVRHWVLVKLPELRMITCWT